MASVWVGKFADPAVCWLVPPCFGWASCSCRGAVRRRKPPPNLRSAVLFGAAADFAEIGRYATNGEGDAVASSLAMGVVKNLTNKTWLSGLSDAFEVLSDPERYGDAYFRKLAGSMAVPAIASQAAQSVDPNMRDARTILDAVRLAFRCFPRACRFVGMSGAIRWSAGSRSGLTSCRPSIQRE